MTRFNVFLAEGPTALLAHLAERHPEPVLRGTLAEPLGEQFNIDAGNLLSLRWLYITGTGEDMVYGLTAAGQAAARKAGMETSALAPGGKAGGEQIEAPHRLPLQERPGPIGVIDRVLDSALLGWGENTPRWVSEQVWFELQQAGHAGPPAGDLLVELRAWVDVRYEDAARFANGHPVGSSSYVGAEVERRAFKAVLAEIDRLAASPAPSEPGGEQVTTSHRVFKRNGQVVVEPPVVPAPSEQSEPGAFVNDTRRCQDCGRIATCRCAVPPAPVPDAGAETYRRAINNLRSQAYERRMRTAGESPGPVDYEATAREFEAAADALAAAPASPPQGEREAALLDRAAHLLGKVGRTVIATKGTLATPYTDAPDKSPYSVYWNRIGEDSWRLRAEIRQAQKASPTPATSKGGDGSHAFD